MFSHSITKAVAATSLHRERNTTAATALCCWKTGLTYLSSDDNILPSLIIERKSVLNGKNLEKENKKQVEGQFDMFNYKLAEIAQELDKVNLNELTPIDALNTLVRIKEKMK